MFNEEFTAASKGAVAKATLLKKNPAGYFLLSVLAGAYIGFGILLVFTLSGALDGAPYTKLVMGCCFGVALTLALIDNGGNEAITMGGYWFNLIVVTFGNMIGAILFVALPYHVGSREKKEDCYE